MHVDAPAEVEVSKVPKGIITWSALGEQNVQAKENYFSLSKGGQFGAVVA